tara:strand:- start:104 stop:238 length:135 start_codon:yes stop_codon:yes gene_type:complete
MIDIIIGITGLVVVLFGGYFAYMSSHIIEEEKQGKRIPLPWEKK